MAKTSMIVKNHRKPKYSAREYTRCERCGRPHAVISKFKLCRICFRELAYTIKRTKGGKVCVFCRLSGEKDHAIISKTSRGVTITKV